MTKSAHRGWLSLLFGFLFFTFQGISSGTTTTTTLHKFGDGSIGNEGTHPTAPLVQGSDGNFYGTNSAGGTAGGGTAFRITPGGVATVLHNFGDGSVSHDGLTPQAGLIQGTDGNFYGTTQYGGTRSVGTVFKMTPGGTVTLLHSFNDGITNDGRYPFTGLVQGTDGNFYGETLYGGTSGSEGTVFKVTSGGTTTILHRFNDGSVTHDGRFPSSGLIQATDGDFYGTTVYGGSANTGTIFKITSSGTVTVLHECTSFSHDGENIYGKIIQGSDGNFYGTTTYGGTAGPGTLFRMTSSGTMTILHNFGDGSITSDGRRPYAGLIEAADGNFYGTTTYGGTSSLGTLFRMTPGGTVTLLHNFTGSSGDGSAPGVSLIQGMDGNFYGTTVSGGASNNGTFFKLATPATPRSWWVSRSAVTGSTINNYAVINQGQLKQFTARAVDELNAAEPEGAGPFLNSLVQDWAQDYAAHGQNPNDYQAMNVGQLKWMGKKLYDRLIDVGHTQNYPAWMNTDPDFNSKLANVGQLKTVFNFDLGLPPLSIISPLSVNAGVGTSFIYAIVTSGSPAPTSYSASGLPAGLSLGTTSGVISGSPTTSGIYTSTLSATNGTSTASAVVTFNVQSGGSVPVITSPTSATAQVGANFVYQITASNSPTQFAASSLPTGLTCVSLNGIISGAVNTAGTYSIGLTATNGAGTSSSVTLSLVITPVPTGGGAVPVFTGVTSASGTKGTSFSHTVVATGATGFSATGLPDGLTINSSGVLSGTPTESGTFSALLTATNSSGNASETFSLTIADTAPTITSPISVSTVPGVSFSYVITCSDSAAVITATSLPSWLSFDADTATLSGTPTSTSDSGTAHLSGETSHGTATATLTITVTDQPVIVSPLTDTTLYGNSYNYSIATRNPAVSFTASPLPTGLSLDPALGVISGTPLHSGVYVIDLSATDSSSNTAYATLTLTVDFVPGELPAIISSPIAYVKAGSAFHYTIVGNNFATSYSISGFPPWVSVNSTTGELSGTPTTAGTVHGTINAIHATNGTASGDLAIAVGVASGNASVTLNYQAGISPASDYQIFADSIKMDPNNSFAADMNTGDLTVGNSPNGSPSTSTEVHRALVGFALPSLPPDAVITDVSLIMTAEPPGGTVASGTSCVLKLYLSPPFGPYSPTWNNNKGDASLSSLSTLTELVSLTTTTPSSATAKTWTGSGSSDPFVTAVQDAVDNDLPLFLMIGLPTAESGAPTNPVQYFSFDMPSNGTSSHRPYLAITYTTAYPPVISSASDLYTASALDPLSLWLYGSSYSNGTLPSGLSLSSSGVLSGTPSSTGSFTMTVSNGNGSDSKTITVNAGHIPDFNTFSNLTASGTVGDSFSYTITTLYSPTSFDATGLPPGLSVDKGTGIISGTPSSSSFITVYTVDLSATNSYGTAHHTLELSIHPSIPPTITPSSLAVAITNGTQLVPYRIQSDDPLATYTFTAAGGSSSLASAGLSFTTTYNSSIATNECYISAVGTISTATTSITGTVTAHNSKGDSDPVPLTITISPMPAPVIPAQTIAAVEGHGFNYGIVTSKPLAADSDPGSVSVGSFSTTFGSLASYGLSLGSPTGTLSGTPTHAATVGSPASIDISAVMGGVTGTGTVTLRVYPPGPGIRSALTDTAIIDKSYDYTLNTVSGASIATSTSATGLPPGLSFTDHGSYGTISGTPTSSATASPYTVTLTASDGTNTSTDYLILTVEPRSAITSASSFSAHVGSSSSFSVTANNHPVGYTVSGLPRDGLSLNETTGVISGTPLAADVFAVNLTVTDESGQTSTQTLTITVDPATSDTPISFQAGVYPTSAYTAPAVYVANDPDHASVADTTYNTGTILPVGTIVSPASPSSTATSQALLTFDLSTLPPNATITSANLVLTPSGSDSSGTAQIAIYQTGPFASSAATWNRNSDIYPTLLSYLGFDASDLDIPSTFPASPAFTQAVQQAYDNPGKKIYLSLLSQYLGSSHIGFVNNSGTASQNPKLKLTYTLGSPSQAPVITSAPVYTGTAGTAVDYTITAANQPTGFSASGLPSPLACNSSTGAITGTVMTVGSTVATIAATNAHGSGSQTVTFNIDSTTQATGLSKTGGDNQVGPPGAFLPSQLVAHATTSSGALSSTLVTFTVAAGEGALSATNTGTPTAKTLSVVTDGSGDAKVYFFTPSALTATMVMARAGTAKPVAFRETSSQLSSAPEDSNLTVLSVISGGGQVVPADTIVPVIIQASDILGKGVPSTDITFHVTKGGGSLSSTHGGSYATSPDVVVTTDATGRAKVYWKPSDDSSPINQISCAADDATTLYVNATALPDTSETPTPGGGGIPSLDSDPTLVVITPPTPESPSVTTEDEIYGYSWFVKVETSGPHSFTPLVLAQYNGKLRSISSGTWYVDDYHEPNVFFAPGIAASPDGSGGGTISSSLFFLDGYYYGWGWLYGYSSVETVTFGGATSEFTVRNSLYGNLISGGYLWDSNSYRHDEPVPDLIVTPKPNARPGAVLTVSSHIALNGNESGVDYDGGTAQFRVPSNSVGYSLSTDEASGSRYRKIALNGLPLPDEKPQQSGETDQEKEETYVDALTDSLRHSTTDIYMPVAGSDLAVSARRDFRSQVWNTQSGLRPHEQPDLPFGPCWSSNLAPNICFVTSSNPYRTSPDQAIVTDETGAVHSFILWYDSTGKRRFFPMPTAKNEQQMPNLETLVAHDTEIPVTYTFTRKYGTTLTYQATSLSQTVADDRLNGSPPGANVTRTYARLIQSRDRVGNAVNYEFDGSLNLIPTTIMVANQPDTKLSIQQQTISAISSGATTSNQSLITAIWDAKGNKTTYGYTKFNTATGHTGATYDWGDPKAYVLTSVTAPDGGVTSYTYNSALEIASSTFNGDFPPPLSSNIPTYWYADLASITDPLSHTYAFTYTFNHCKWQLISGGQIRGYYAQPGSPRNVATVTLPGSQGTTRFSTTDSTGKSKIWPDLDPDSSEMALYGAYHLTVTDATGFVRTYRFGKPKVVPIPQIPGPGGSGTSFAEVIAFESLDIEHGAGSTYLGKESFEFDLDAAMALKKVTDLSGNVTTYAHGETWTLADDSDYKRFKDITSVALTSHYDDPSMQTDALGHSKTFSYDTATRIMTDIVNENGDKTHYVIDTLGRRTSEIKKDADDHVIQETDFAYENPTYPGFMTKKTITDLGNDSDPDWVSDLVTQYVPDGNGRVAQEIVDPNGLHLVTCHTYDKNGNKISATDPLGHTTWFSYDNRNRLITVSFPDGGQKQMVYDTRGNKVIEYDENGIATLFQYDALNRLTSQVRDMNGNGGYNTSTHALTGVDSSTDLVTSYTYNAVNSKLTVTDPRSHATTMTYDHLQRVTQIKDALGNLTQFQYGANSGSGAFDSSSFKPTHTVDPRGYVTDVAYDKLYRPISKSVQFQSGMAPVTKSVMTTQYDNVGNVTLVADPLGNQTTNAYDALNRLVQTTFADNTSSENSFVHYLYSSTGLKCQTLLKNGDNSSTHTHEQITDIAYDSAGRPTTATQPLVVYDAASHTAQPVTTTVYDAAGNTVEIIKDVNPDTQEIWDYAYDARNRKVQEFAPPVTNAEPDTDHFNESVRPIRTWTYDAGGRVLAITDARHHTTAMTYDAANRVTDTDAPSVSIAGGGSGSPNTHATYDLNGNVLTLRDPNTHTTTNTYDNLDRLRTTTDAAGNVVTYEYDAVGNRTRVIDGNNHSTLFAYDGLNRNTKITDSTGRATEFKYDGLNKIQRVDALGQVTNYVYDQRNRLIHTLYVSGDAANSKRNYTYDRAGNLLTVCEPDKTEANVTYTYDLLNRVLTETSGGKTHNSIYDLVGNRVQIEYAHGTGSARTLTSTYDGLNRLATMTDDIRVTSYAYDLNGNIVTKTLPNGDTEAQTFDVLNRMKTQDGTKLSGTTGDLYSLTYAYDLVGNARILTETYPSGLSNRTVTNTYDCINRLHVETVTGSAPNSVTTYAYDAANNRTGKAITGTGAASHSYTYNNLNQLTGTTDGTRSVAYTYDLNGNRATRTVTGGSDNGTDTYGYDFENRLIGLVKGTSGGAGTYAYGYDYRTRRIVRDETSASGDITHVVFSGGTSVQEYDGTTPALTVEYLRGSDYGGGVGGILYTIRGSTPSYTHDNRRGDIIAKTDSSGTLTYQAQYEAFGKQTQTTGSTLDRQKSNSKDTDPTGLVDEGFRYRDLETGMFITRDPAGFVDGPNLYTYVVQNPWTKFDPEGLNEVIVSGGVSHDPKGDDEHHDSDWKHFVKAAELDISARKNHVKKDEQIEWLVEKSTYVERGKADGKDYVKEIEGIAEKQGVALRWYNNKDELVDELNHGIDGKARSGAGLISHFDYFGHGRPGVMMTKFYDPTGDLDTQDLAAGRLRRDAFAPKSTAENHGCNGATPQYDTHESVQPNGQPSFDQAWQDATGVHMGGLVGRSDYSPSAELGTKEILNSFNPFSGPTRTPTGPVPGVQNWGPDRGKPSYWVP